MSDITAAPSEGTERPAEDDLVRTVSLIRRANAGEQEAWTLLYDRCIGLIRGLVRMQTGRHILVREEVDDLAMTVLHEMVKGLPTLEYRSHGEFVGWIVRLVRSTVAARGNYYGAKKRPPVAQPITTGASEGGIREAALPGHKTEPALGAQRRDEFHFLMRCARHLNAAERGLVKLFLIHGNDMKGMGRALGVKPDAARMRWNRVADKLKAIARQGGPPSP